MNRIIIVFTFVLAACGGPQELQGTSNALGADATLDVTSGDDTNEILLEAQHLPPPDRVLGGATHYAVWIVPNGRQPVLGALLDYDVDSRDGDARMTTPYDSFEVRVTAERNATPASPSSEVVLRRRVDTD